MTNPVETKIRAAVQSVEPSNEFSKKLLRQIENTPRPIPSSNIFSRWFWIPASAVVIIAMILVVLSPQKVAAAVRSLIAYLPGIGFIQNDGNTLYLPEPLLVEKEGITLTIEQVVADENNTVISYRIDGLPESNSGVAFPCFYDNNRLLLGDGKFWLPTGGEAENNQARVEFYPLPEKITRATLVVSMNFPDPACTAPQEWKVDFSLSSTPPNEPLMPVFESQETTTPSTELPKNPAAGITETDRFGIRFNVDRTAVLENGYLLLGHIKWENENLQNVIIDMSAIDSQDATGKNVALEPNNESNKDNAFSFKVIGKEFTAPLTFHLHKLLLIANMENNPTFVFSVGSNPQVEQSWELNLDLEILGQKITINKVTVVQATNEQSADKPVYGFAVEVNSATSMNGFIVCSSDRKTTNSWGQTMPIDNTHQIMESYYPDGLPNGQVSCEFQQAQILLPGSWQFEWQPPSTIQ